MRRLALALLLAACGSDPAPEPDEPRTEEPAPLPPAVTPEQERAHASALQAAESSEVVLPEGVEAMTPAAAPSGSAPAEIVPQLRIGPPLDVSSDGRLALAPGPAGLALVDVRSGRIRAWLPSRAHAREASFDGSDGRTLVELHEPAEDDYSDSGTRVVLWDLATGQRTRIAGASNAFLAGAWRPDGQRVVTVTGDRWLNAADVDGGEEEIDEAERGIDVTVRDLAGERMRGVRLDAPLEARPRYSLDGSRVLLHGREQIVILDAELAPVGRVEGQWGVSSHPDGGAWLLESASEVRVVDLDGATRHTVEPSEGGAFVDAAWTEDGARLVVMERDRVRVLHGRTLAPLWSFDGGVDPDSIWSSDGERFVEPVETTLRVRSGRTGAPVRAPIEIDAEYEIEALRWLGGHVGYTLLDGTSGVIDLEDGQPRRFGGERALVPLYAVRWFGPSRLRAHGMYEPIEPTGVLWQSSGVEANDCLRVEYPVDMDYEYTEAWHPTGPYVLVTESLNAGAISACAHGAGGGDGAGGDDDGEIVADGRWIVWREEDAARISDARHPDRRRRLPLADGERLLAISADGQTLLGRDGPRLRVVRRAGGAEVCRFEHADVFEAGLAPDGSSLWIHESAADERLVFSVADGECVRRATLPERRAVRALPGGVVLVLGEGTVQLRGGPELAVRATLRRDTWGEVEPLGEDQVTVQRDGAVVVHSLTDGAEVRRAAGFTRVTGTRFARTCDDDRETVLDLRDGSRVTSTPCSHGALAPDGRWTANIVRDAIVLRREGLEARLFALADRRDRDAPTTGLVIAGDRYERLRAPVDVAFHRASGPLRSAELTRRPPTRGLLRELLSAPAQAEDGEAE